MSEHAWSARGSAPALAFERVFSDYAGYVLGLLRRLGVSDGDAEDVAQEVFMAVHAGLPSFEGRSALKTWICGICLRRAADYRRKAHRRRERLTAQPPEQHADDALEERLVAEQRAAELNAVIAQLPDKLLQVFVLYELEELPMSDVARMVGCPRFTAYTRLRKARREVRALLAALAANAAAPAVVVLPASRGTKAWWLGGVVALLAAGLLVRPQFEREAKQVHARAVERRALKPTAPPPRPGMATTPTAVPADRASATRGPESKRGRSVPEARTRAHQSAPEQELALLQRSQRALAQDPAAALALAEQHARAYPRGVFEQEREMLAIEALLQLRRKADAVARAERFVQRFPDSPHARRVRVLLERSHFRSAATSPPPPSDSSANEP